MLQIARSGAIAICDSNRESQITSDFKGSALRFCCDLKKASNHKLRDLSCDLKRFWQRFWGIFLRFGLRDLKSLATCDLWFGALSWRRVVWCSTFSVKVRRCPSTASSTVPSGESPTFWWILSWESNQQSNRLKALLMEISLSEYGSEVFRVRLRRLYEYGSVAYWVERPTRETQAHQYSDTILKRRPLKNRPQETQLPTFSPRNAIQKLG